MPKENQFINLSFCLKRKKIIKFYFKNKKSTIFKFYWHTFETLPLRNRNSFEFANFTPAVVPHERIGRSSQRKSSGAQRSCSDLLIFAPKARGSLPSRPQAQQSSSVQLIVRRGWNNRVVVSGPDNLVLSKFSTAMSEWQRECRTIVRILSEWHCLRLQS